MGCCVLALRRTTRVVLVFGHSSYAEQPGVEFSHVTAKYTNWLSGDTATPLMNAFWIFGSIFETIFRVEESITRAEPLATYAIGPLSSASSAAANNALVLMPLMRWNVVLLDGSVAIVVLSAFT